MRMIPPVRRLRARSSIVPTTPPAIHVAPTQACHTDLLVRDIAGSIAMNELDSIGNAEFFSTEFRLLGEQLAHVDAGADDSVIACPGAQHLPRTAAEVEHPGSPFQTQRRAESGELFGCERVMDAVSTFGDVEDPWNIQCRKSPYGCE